MTFRVLLFGSNGQLGRCFQNAIRGPDLNLIALDRAAADFSDPETVYQSVLDNRPDCVVNACAYTAVDKAESERELAFRVNAESVGRLGEACNSLQIPVFHVSTDYVFDGTATMPYSEQDPTSPASVYGASKLQGEINLDSTCARHVILRTSWVFSEYGANFVKTMLRLALERDQLGVVADQRGCPTYAGDIADVIAELVNRYRRQGNLPWGTYHLTGSGECSWYEFAQVIFLQGVDSGLLKRVPEVNQLSTAEYPTAAARPAYSALDCGKLHRDLGISTRDWRAGLARVCSIIGQDNK